VSDRIGDRLLRAVCLAASLRVAMVLVEIAVRCCSGRS
jgi:hypothetical protein